MKLLQAIVTSSVETLDGRQGIGLVACSRLMPEPIKKQAAEWGSPSNGNRAPVYSYKLVPDASSSWAVMNQTIPVTDYTGRTIHVSHTVAISVEELSDFFRLHSEAVITPSEFMLGYKWKNSWNETPHWIEEVEDVNSADILALRSKDFTPFDWHPAAALLAFQIDGIEIPKPKRLAWKSGNLTSEGVLRLFHSAWLAIDPWRGRRDYGDHLGEPPASVMDSWECTWTTDLRDERPDDYQWVILTPGASNLGNREVIDVTEWKAKDEGAIARMLGASGGLLVARSKSPEEWAQGEISRLIEELELNQNTAIESSLSELRSSTEGIFFEAEEHYLRNIKLSHQWEPYLRSIDNTGAFNNAVGHITELKSRFESIISGIKKKTIEVDQIHDDSIKPLLALRKTSDERRDNGESRHSGRSDFEEFHNRYQILEAKIQPTLFFLSAAEIAKHLADKSVDLETQISTLKDELKSESDAKKKILNSIGQDLSHGKKPVGSAVSSWRSGSNQFPWQLPTLIAVTVLALALGAIVILYRDRLFSKNPEPNKPLIETEDKLKERERQIKSQSDLIDELRDANSKKEAVIAQKKTEFDAALKQSKDEMDKEIIELKKTNNKLDDELKKRDNEPAMKNKSSSEKPTVSTSIKEGGHGEGDTSKSKNADSSIEVIPKSATSAQPSSPAPKSVAPNNGNKNGISPSVSDEKIKP